MFINGKRVKNKNTFDVIYPYTNEVIDKVCIATKEDIFKAMRGSYEIRKNLTVDQRVEILKNAAKRVNKQEKELAKLITSESGLSLKDTTHELHRVYDVLTLASKIVPGLEKDTSSRYVYGVNENPKLTVISEPLDLVLGITPFNHPMNQVAHKIAPAIVAGAAIILKPSEKTPLSAIKLTEILHEEGLPTNMLNVITTNKPSQFLEDALSLKMAQLVAFIGGVDVGKHIMRRLTATGNEMVKYLPELGGNSAFTVLEDANVKLAAKIAMNAYANSGQRCTSIKKILLHNAIADEFIEEFLKLTGSIKYGDPMNPSTGMGTVINENAAKMIQSRVEAALKQGAKLLHGNKREGALYSPTLLDNVDYRSELVVKETFGPVAPIIRIDNVHDAIKVINSVNYKLAGAVMTKNRDYAKLISDSIKVGQFNWNNNPGYRFEQAPFGGFGDSGNGEKEGVLLAAEGMRRIRTFYEH